MPGPVRFLLRVSFLVAIWVCVGLPARADERIDCTSMQSRILHRAVRYCVEIPASYDAPEAKDRRYPVLYFLHGLGDNEQTLFRTGGWTLIEDLREKHKIGEFLIAAPDGGRGFFINSVDGKDRYSDFFVQEFMPAIEKKYRVLPGRAGRAITGVSMGGYGALRFAFAYPQMFAAVSAQSAALITESPKDLNAAANSGSPIVQTLSAVFGSPINVAHWDANSPFALARRNAPALRRVAIYFNCGQRDDYGFEKGAVALDKELNQEHVPHEYHSYPGDHSLSYFLLHFPEILEFHSRAFSSK